jgi:heme-degrading monooxygenase HmoA
MFAFWQTAKYFNIFSKKSQQKLATKRHKKHKGISGSHNKNFLDFIGLM